MTSFSGPGDFSGAGSLTQSATPLFTVPCPLGTTGSLVTLGQPGLTALRATLAYDSAGVAANVIELPLPPAVSDQDYGFLLVSWQADATGGVSAPGWTDLVGTVHSNQMYFAVLARRHLTADDPTVVLTFDTTVITSVGGVWYNHVDSIDVVGVVGNRSGSTSPDVTAPSLTTATIGAELVLSCFTERSPEQGTTATFSGGTQRLYFEGTSGNECSVLWLDLLLPSAGPSGDVVATYSTPSGSGGGLQIAINPTGSVLRQGAAGLGTEGSLSVAGTAIGAGSFPGTFTSASQNNGTSLTLARPSLSATPIHLFALVTSEYGDVLWSVPDGWTQLGIYSGDLLDTRVYYKYLPSPAAEPASYLWTATNVSPGLISGMILSYPGLDPAHPVDSLGAAIIQQDFITSIISIPEDVVVADGSDLLAVVAQWSRIATVASPSLTGPTEIHTQVANAPVGTRALSTSAFWQGGVPAANTGPVDGTLSGAEERSIGFLFAVAKAPQIASYLGAQGSLTAIGHSIPPIASFGTEGSLTAVQLLGAFATTEGTLAARGAVVGTASFGATGALASSPGVPTGLGSNGTLGSTQKPKFTIPAALGTVGTFASTGAPRPKFLIGLSGSGSLGIVGVPKPTGQARPGGGGSLVAAGSPRTAVNGSLGSVGRLSSVSLLSTSTAAAVSGSGSLAAALSKMTATVSGSLGGTGSLSISPVALFGPFGYPTPSASGSLAAIGYRNQVAPVGETLKPPRQWAIDYGI